MKFLIDEALSPKVAVRLKEAGYDAVHVSDYQMQGAADSEILKRAEFEERIVVSADTDFGTLLAKRQQVQPSFILLRGGPRRPEEQAQMLVRNLPPLKDELEKGCIVVFHEQKIRVRPLPILPT